ncbi:MAG: hypothetical protein U1E72_06665 [Burkholderiaceae bacterium]
MRCASRRSSTATRALREAMFNVRALIAPASVALDAQALHFAPVLRAVGRLSAGTENLDVDAFARAGVEIVRPSTASAGAEAEVRHRRDAATAAPCRCAATTACWSAAGVRRRWAGGHARSRGRWPSC